MEPRLVQSARREEFERVPGLAFAVDLHTVHVCAGPGARFAFCGIVARKAWELVPMDRWRTGWVMCEGCGGVVAELDGLTRPA